MKKKLIIIVMVTVCVGQNLFAQYTSVFLGATGNPLNPAYVGGTFGGVVEVLDFYDVETSWTAGGAKFDWDSGAMSESIEGLFTTANVNSVFKIGLGNAFDLRLGGGLGLGIETFDNVDFMFTLNGLAGICLFPNAFFSLVVDVQPALSIMNSNPYFALPIFIALRWNVKTMSGD